MHKLSSRLLGPLAAVLAMAIGSGTSAVMGASEQSSAEDALLSGFRDPPQSARPQVWWHWMNGNVSSQGAKLDLEWMQRVGVGGVHIFAGSLFEPHVIEPPIDFMSERWKSIFREATLMARQDGMTVTIAGSPGWSETGGTWVAPEHGMKKYVWSELQLEGGRRFDGLLPRPPATVGPFLGVKRAARGASAKELKEEIYHDSVVVAFPTPVAETAVGDARWATSAGTLDLSALRAGDLSEAVRLPLRTGSDSAWIQATYPHATMLSALTLGLSAPADVTIEAAETEGQPLRTLVRAKADHSEAPAPERTYAFTATRAKVFRVTLMAPPPQPPLPGLPPMLSAPPTPPDHFAILRLAFSGGARIDHFESKAGFQSTGGGAGEPTPAAPEAAIVPVNRVIDLTSNLDDGGKLHWTPPAGHWTVLRLGWSLTGQTNGPAEEKDTGLEVDKLDPVTVRAYIEQYLSMYESAMGSKLGAANVGALLTDSWEAGVQNWTPVLLDQFKRLRGYDATPYLPCLAGHVVESADASDRFLWDFYRTLKESLADNHYQVLAEALHARGMHYYTESQGDTPRAIGDGMTIKSRSDIPTAEFWYRPFATVPGQPSLIADLDEAASAAHVYGKTLAAAESMTVAAGTDPWAFSPAMLKPVADEIFAHGINRILVHESHHQPFVNKAPGLELGFFGQFFNRNDTWAEEARPWVSYLSRTSYLLQQGHAVADVAMFYGEDQNLTERYQYTFNREIPAGYAFDYINPEALLKLLSVRGGRLITPGGASYRVLYLPAYVTRVTLPVLRKLRDLVKDGAIVVGQRPVGGLGLESPDPEVRALVDEIWRSSGVYGDLHDALDAQAIMPDVAANPGEAPTGFIHRQAADAEIYFLTNSHAPPKDVCPIFRVSGKRPEIWHAEDGRIEAVSYEQTSAGVRVCLHLEENAAELVVFRGKAPLGKWSAPAMKTTVLTALDGPWAVKFQAGRGAPAAATFERLTDWSVSSDFGVKYFSGAAVYSRQVTVPPAWMRQGRRVVLDLGDVRELAVVSVDGTVVSTAWHAPFQADLTSVLTPGAHKLDIKVVNLWVNRLIGDQQPGATPVAFAPQSPYTAHSVLRKSGLLGPVRLLARDDVSWSAKSRASRGVVPKRCLKLR